MATNFPQLWNDPATADRDRKRMVRLLIEDVTMRKGAQVQLDVRFRGGMSKTAEVTASSLFEAVAQGLLALRKNEWVEGMEERFGFVKVSVADVRVEHQVKIADFMKWLERPGRTPREITHRLRIRAILGMSVSR